MSFHFLDTNSSLFWENNLLQDMWRNWWLRLLPEWRTPLCHIVSRMKFQTIHLPCAQSLTIQRKTMPSTLTSPGSVESETLIASILFWISGSDFVDCTCWERDPHFLSKPSPAPFDQLPVSDISHAPMRYRCILVLSQEWCLSVFIFVLFDLLMDLYYSIFFKYFFFFFFLTVYCQQYFC